MINEKKLLEKLEELKFANEERGYDTAKDVIQEIIDLVNEQPKTDCSECSRRKFYQQGYQDGLNADRWIPCEERLPDKRGNYLVCSKGVTWVANWFLNTWWGIEKRCRYSDVEAWQPLPQPYKKEGGEDE